jgi:predicted membrane protein
LGYFSLDMLNMAVFLSITSLVIYLIIVYYVITRRAKGSSKRSNGKDEVTHDEMNSEEVTGIEIELTDVPGDQTKEELKQRLIQTFRAIKQIESGDKDTLHIRQEGRGSKENKGDVITEINRPDENVDVEKLDGDGSGKDTEVKTVEWIRDNEIDF